MAEENVAEKATKPKKENRENLVEEVKTLLGSSFAVTLAEDFTEKDIREQFR